MLYSYFLRNVTFIWIAELQRL